MEFPRPAFSRQHRAHPMRSLAALASAVTLSLLLLGCGDSDAADDTSPATDAANTDSSSAETSPAESTPTESQPDATGDAPAGGDATVDIADFAYDPSPIEVSAGTEITWTNKDEALHTVTNARGGELEFDSGDLEQDAPFSFTFDEAGTYDYVCSIHNSMTSSVVVT